MGASASSQLDEGKCAYIRDQLVIFKTFFPVLMRCQQPYPKSIIAVHYASNRK